MDISMELANLKVEITLYDGGGLSADRLIEGLESTESFYEKLGLITGFKNFFQKTIEIYTERITELDSENVSFLDEKSKLEQKLNEMLECCKFQVSLLDWYMEKLKSQKLEDKETLSNVDKIYWKGSEPEIIALFDLLNNTGLIDEESYNKRYHLISRHFKNKSNASFKANNLSVAYQKMDYHKALHRIVEEIAKIKS